MPRVDTVQLDVARFAERSRELLISRSDLATRVCCSRMTVWQAATGRAVSVRIARRIAKILRLSIRELLAIDEELAGGGELGSVAGVADAPPVGHQTRIAR